MKFAVEHLDPEIYEWNQIEYEHISEIVGKLNLIFTNVKNSKDKEKLKKLGAVYSESISQLNLGKLCVLSQYAKKTLETKDRNNFDCFVFGGILGDNPAKRRTEHIISELKSKKIPFEERNLGDKQMPTDNAVYCTKKILEGKKLSDFRFADELEVQINENESVNLKFRYIIDNKKVILSEKLVEHLRKRQEF